jgi:hypothetical protein
LFLTETTEATEEIHLTPGRKGRKEVIAPGGLQSGANLSLSFASVFPAAEELNKEGIAIDEG